MTKFELSDREKAVIILKIAGLGDKEIAEKLSISYGTVRTYIDRAKIKLGCENMLQLVVTANSMFNK